MVAQASGDSAPAVDRPIEPTRQGLAAVVDELRHRLAESQDAERRRLAQELHDGIGGYITGISLLAQSLKLQLMAADSPCADSADDLVHGINAAKDELRTLIRELRRVEPTPLGLLPALRELTARTARHYGVPCSLECEGLVVVDDRSARHLLRIAQEAVHNAARHARASHIVVSLVAMDRGLEITVADDGIGLPALPADHAGTGLESMRRRAALMSGNISIQTGEGIGTVVACWIPQGPITKPTGLTGGN
jgi:signal transduction histidine kinase